MTHCPEPTKVMAPAVYAGPGRRAH
jgi:hypothetical protein